jgi:adenylate cyclase
MAKDRLSGKLAVILHADVAGSTALVQKDEHLAHERIQDTFRRFSGTIERYQGRVRELRGDALLAEFDRASDAVTAVLAFQAEQAEYVAQLNDNIQPVVRVGIALGEVIIADNTVTGAGVVLAQRIEQLAEPGGLCITAAIHEALPQRMPFDQKNLGEQHVKGFDEHIRVYAMSLTPGSTIPKPNIPPQGEALRLPDKPSIAVLPFTNMSGDPEQEYFADGLVDDIITTLSKLSGLLVIARDSCFVYKDRKVDVRQVARELGVQYVLEGSVRIVSKRVRINVRFTDAKMGANIWAQRYDREIGDIFAVQDEVTLALATEMQVQFLEGEQARLQYSTTQNVDAWSNWVKGLFYFRASLSNEHRGKALECWETAISLDPKSASLNAILGYLHCVNARFGWWHDRETVMLKSSAYIEKALKLESNNAEAHRASGFHLLLRNCHDEAVAEIRKAENLSPSSADIAATASYIYSCSGLADEAVIAIERAIRRHPNHPPRYFGHLGNAYRLAGRFDEAITAFNEYHELSPGYGLIDLVLINKQLDRNEEAIFEATRLLAVNPEFTVRAWIDTQFLKDPARLESEISALTESGLPLDK